MAVNCAKLFKECYQNSWVNWDERSTFLKRCERHKQGPALPVPTNTQMTNDGASMKAPGISASRPICRRYAGSTIHREALSGPAFWTTSTFQILATVRHVDQELTVHADKIVAAGGLLVLGVVAVVRLRNGCDTSGFQLLMQRTSKVF